VSCTRKTRRLKKRKPNKRHLQQRRRRGKRRELKKSPPPQVMLSLRRNRVTARLIPPTSTLTSIYLIPQTLAGLSRLRLAVHLFLVLLNFLSWMVNHLMPQRQEARFRTCWKSVLCLRKVETRFACTGSRLVLRSAH
jgi:hypothetical protein